MNLVQAIELTNDCQRARKLMGMNAIYPYTPDQFVNALGAFHGQISEQLAHIKKLEAQLRAANARGVKLSG